MKCETLGCEREGAESTGDLCGPCHYQFNDGMSFGLLIVTGGCVVIVVLVTVVLALMWYVI